MKFNPRGLFPPRTIHSIHYLGCFPVPQTVSLPSKGKSPSEVYKSKIVNINNVYKGPPNIYKS